MKYNHVKAIYILFIYFVHICMRMQPCAHRDWRIASEFSHLTRRFKRRSGLAVDALTTENLTIPRYFISSKEYLTSAVEFDVLPNIRQRDSVAATNQLRILISNSIFMTIAVQNQIRSKKNYLNIFK